MPLISKNYCLADRSIEALLSAYQSMTMIDDVTSGTKSTAIKLSYMATWASKGFSYIFQPFIPQLFKIDFYCQKMALDPTQTGSIFVYGPLLDFF